MARKKKPTGKRSLFRELMAGVDTMREHREGRLALRTHDVEPISLPELDPRVARETGGRINHHQDDRMRVETATARLARAIERHIHSAGDHSTALPSLSLHRRDAPTGPLPCIYPLSLAVMTQGAKQVLVGEKILTYVPGQSLVTTIDLPVVSHVTRATRREPFLALLLKLDARAIALATSEMAFSHPAGDHVHEPMSIERLDPALLDALCRLVDLLDEPIVLPRLAPVIQQEIVIRLLTGPHGPHLRQLVTKDSPSRQVATIVAWLRKNFTESARVDDLAAKANMSPSAFRTHFHEITGMSPLRYQKRLRLQEARQLMLHRHLDAGQAAGLVGYLSPSQFSREYSRMFGAPPRRDVRRMKSSQPFPARPFSA